MSGAAVTRAAGSRRAAAAGLVVVAAVALLLVAGRGSGRLELTASFDQVHGLVEGAEVKSGGFVIGKVRDIALGRDGRPEVRLEVDEDVAPRRTATADVRLFSVAGEVNRYVDLTAGSGPPLRDGDRIAPARTDAPVEIDQLLSTLDPATRADVRGLLHGLERATDGRGPDVEAALRRSAGAVGQTAELLAGLRGDGDALERLVRQSRRVVGALARDAEAPGAAVGAVAGVLDATAARQAQLAAGLRALPAGLRSPRKALEQTGAAVGDLRGVVRDARPAVVALRTLSPDLTSAARAARPALAQAQGLVRTGPADLRALRPLLRTATPVLGELVPVLRSANPMLDQLRARLPDVFAFFANWADFTANYDGNGHAARIGLVFAPPPLHERGPSDTRPGHLRAPFARTPGVLEGEPWTDFEQSFVGSAP